MAVKFTKMGKKVAALNLHGKLKLYTFSHNPTVSLLLIPIRLHNIKT